VKPRVTIVTATEHEIAPVLAWLGTHAESHTFQTYFIPGLQVDILYTGIGPMYAMYALTEYLSHRRPDGWLQAGIGGAFDPALTLGTTYAIHSETLAGFGAEDADGTYLNAFDLGWQDPDAHPLTGGRWACPYVAPGLALPEATGMTTWVAHGFPATIDRIARDLHGQVENMEGAPFFHISLLRRIPFLSFRAISNKVEARDKSAWVMQPAVDDLGKTIIRWLTDASGDVHRLFGHRI